MDRAASSSDGLRPGRQRGSAAMTMLFLLLGCITMLGLAEVAYLYWAKRDTQKVADLAALAGAQRLDTCAGDGNDAARSNAVKDNNFGGRLDIACGYWDPQHPGDQHFATDTDTSQFNAVRVTATRPVLPLLGFAGNLPDVSATAIAANRGNPIAAFSVGSSLLSLSQSGPLDELLKSTLGTSLGLNILSDEGIANANVSLLGLKNLLSLDAGTVDGVLDTDIKVGQLLDAVVRLIQKNGNTASVDLGLLQQQVNVIEASLGNV